MKRLVVFSILGLLAWFILTAAWASAAHVAGIPGPGETAAASMNLTARAVTVAELPGTLGAPQRVAARELRRAGHAMERLYRIPERSISQFLDRFGHAGHGHRHVVRHFDRHNVHVDVPVQDIGERVRKRLEEVRRRLEDKERVLERRSHKLERVQERLERRHSELLERMERGANGLEGSLIPIEVELQALERVRVELERARAQLESAMPQIEIELSQIDVPDIEIEIPRIEVH